VGSDGRQAGLSDPPDCFGAEENNKSLTNRRTGRGNYGKRHQNGVSGIGPKHRQ
jgi:hypothetical protein